MVPMGEGKGAREGLYDTTNWARWGYLGRSQLDILMPRRLSTVNCVHSIPAFVNIKMTEMSVLGGQRLLFYSRFWYPRHDEIGTCRNIQIVLVRMEREALPTPPVALQRTGSSYDGQGYCRISVWVSDFHICGLWRSSTGRAHTNAPPYQRSAILTTN